MSKQRALGKGIGALIAGGGEEKAESTGVNQVPLSALSPNPDQPRREFAENALAELAESIRARGVLQPVLVEAAAGGGYTIIAGERRVRAARLAGLQNIPAIVRQFSSAEKLEIALIENIQREDLTPIEEAQAYRRLMESASLSQEEVASQVGKDRSTVANSLRLLKLPPEMQEAVDRAEMSAGHARAILAVVSPADQGLLFRKILEEGLSVREAEQLATEMNRGKKPPGKGGRGSGPAPKRKEPELRAMEETLIERLGTKVEIKGSGTRGRIEISYFTTEDLERVADLLRGRQ
jgi:ParB family transcriptional regulator, chromosome partitioning protein